MLKIRDAKALFAATVLVAPWDIVLFDGGVGWGLTFPFGRFVVVQGTTRFLGPLQLLDLYIGLGSQGTAGVFVTLAWILSIAVAVAAAGYAITGRIRRGGTTIQEDRRAGVAFAVSGLLFLVSRIAGASVLTWTSIPVGAAYVLLVAAVFYWGLFRLGAG
jgi:hypothetical protein